MTELKLWGAEPSKRPVSFVDAAVRFEHELPFRLYPYSKRNWGHSLHSLCSYQGKLKPAIAYFLVERFTRLGETVFDPLAGVGTIPFEACLQGRVGIANDINSVAYANCLAKVGSASINEVKIAIARLETYILANLPTPEEAEAIQLDINGPIQSYYEQRTLREILAARRYYREFPVRTSAEAMVFASLLHILHGNRPYALSRRSHPVTPFSPSGVYEYRPLIPRLTQKALRSVSADKPETFRAGYAVQGPFEDLSDSGIEADAIITSPPFFGSTRFYLSNWLRLWFAGWEKEDFSLQRSEYLETRQQQDMDVYVDFMSMCEAVLKPGGKLVVHLGKSKRCDMAQEFVRRLTPGLELVYRFDEDVSAIEKHGLSDKGATSAHQFIFITRR